MNKPKPHWVFKGNYWWRFIDIAYYHDSLVEYRNGHKPNYEPFQYPASYMGRRNVNKLRYKM